MRKSDFCLYSIKTAQLIRDFVFATRLVESLFFLNPKFQASSLFQDCTARFVLDLVEMPKTRFVMLQPNG